MKNILSKTYITLFFLLVSFITFAAETEPGDEADGSPMEGADAAAAPIGDYVWGLALLGILFVFMKFREIQKRKINS